MIAAEEILKSEIDSILIAYVGFLISKAISTRKRKIDDLSSRLQETTKKLKTSLSKLEHAKVFIHSVFH